MVCIVHLKAGGEEHEITRLAQVAALLEKLEDLRRGPEYANKPLVICGDFNCSPSSQIYKLLTTGTCDNVKVGLLPNQQLRHGLELKSAYAHYSPNGEPSYTARYKKGATVSDYIFYSTKGLTPVALLNIPEKEGQLLSSDFPSDHMSLQACFACR